MKWEDLLSDFRLGREEQYKPERHRRPWQAGTNGAPLCPRDSRALERRLLKNLIHGH
jgi:hypothetical protein